MRAPLLRSLTRVVLCAAGVFASLQSAMAQSYPDRPVKLVVPFAAGGAADALARLYGEALSAAFGKGFIVENRPGGGGIVGAEAVARAEPDGHTLLLSGIPIQVLGPAMNRNVGYHPMRDFTHIAYFGGTPNVLVVHPSLGVASYRDFVARAKNQKEGIEYVSAGFGTMGNWVAEYLAVKENIRLIHVAYRGGSSALQDLIAGHVKLGMLSGAPVAEQIRAGKLLALAATSGRRQASLADVPTLAELGHSDFVATTWFSLSGPAGVPKDVVESINREVVKAMERPQVKRQIEQDAIETRAMTPAEVAAFSQGEIDRWTPLIRQMMAKER